MFRSDASTPPASQSAGRPARDSTARGYSGAHAVPAASVGSFPLALHACTARASGHRASQTWLLHCSLHPAGAQQCRLVEFTASTLYCKINVSRPSSLSSSASEVGEN